MKLRFSHVLVIGLVALGGAAASGCGSSDSDSGGHAAATSFPGVGEHDSVAITAATGGTVSGTGVSLAIPPGALSADTTITVDIKSPSSYADTDTIAVNVFDFGPNGTTFTTPVALTLDLQGQAVPAGKVANLAYFDVAASAWKVLDGSTVANGKVTANTTHFTAFTIVWSPAGGQSAGGCASLDFTPCGGDLTGTWSFSAGCYDLPPGAGDPTGGKCPQATVSATVDLSGSVTFNADATYSVDSTTSADISIDVPASCLSANNVSCSQLSGTDDGSGGCELHQTQPAENDHESGTYTTSGTQFITTETGDTPDDPIEYCVTGNTLRARGTDSDGNTTIYIATKQ